MRFKGLDLNLLIALDVLLEMRSVSRTAERLNMSQPAVSAALGRLRQYFKDELLLTIGRRMIPTAHAEALWPMVRELLANAEALIDTSGGFDPTTSQRRFRINASDYVVAVLIAPLLHRIHARAPHVSIDIGPTGSLSMAQFEAGEVDVIIIPEEYRSPMHPARLLFEEQHVVVGWRENPALASPISIDRFLELGHITVSIGNGREMSFAERHLLPYRDRRRIEVSSPSFSGVPIMLEHTARVAVLQERLAHTFRDAFSLLVQPLPFDMPPLREFAQVHSARTNDAGISWLLDELLSIDRGSNGGNLSA